MDIKYPVMRPYIDEAEKRLVAQSIDDGWISSIGPYVERFERLFAEYAGAPYALSCSNGTTALHLALMAIDLAPGDEVIVPDITFIATANAVTYAGATSVLVDVEPDTWAMDPKEIEKKITKRTKAIIPVHLYGHPADMDPIMAIAKANGIAVVEDAAESLGARYKGRFSGCIGDIGCFSFYGNKIITTGEGGMVVTASEELYKKMQLLRNHGMTKERRYWHPVIGYNYRMTSLQAAFGCGQMEKVDAIVKKRVADAAVYHRELAGVPGIVPHPCREWAYNVYWMYSILVEDPTRRDGLMQALLEDGIETRPFFYPVHEMPRYERPNEYPVSTRLARAGINLPTYFAMTEQDIVYICGRIKAHVQRA
ncbi:MAG TPA: DegT/DnrJ/EryC1/StrS family aminotransferase [Spirochaetota bacterium]|nr:DegT/DnrJ/EryC1/StrS family aminotransferase [Spirochaetota bacterium]HNT09867.1 DegT/DnrJ/EryC1/StrS family aminotransferase [Spirochaetota bacterium]